MAHYLLSIQQPDGEPPAPEVLGPIMRDVAAVAADMQTAGVWVFAGGLAPASSSTVVRQQNGQAVTTDGPYTEGKEHVGDLNVIDVPDLDAALEWARKLSAATTLPIEVRPFQDRS